MVAVPSSEPVMVAVPIVRLVESGDRASTPVPDLEPAGTAAAKTGPSRRRKKLVAAIIANTIRLRTCQPRLSGTSGARPWMTPGSQRRSVLEAYCYCGRDPFCCPCGRGHSCCRDRGHSCHRG